MSSSLSKLILWMKNPNPDFTLANWLKDRRNKQRLKALQEHEDLIRLTASQLWEQDNEPKHDSQYYWSQATTIVNSKKKLSL